MRLHLALREEAKDSAGRSWERPFIGSCAPFILFSLTELAQAARGLREGAQNSGLMRL